MQGRGIHRVQERVKTLPSHLGALTAADENAPPQPADATTKDAQLSRVARNGMVLVVSQHNLSKPGTDLGRMMLAALKLSLDGFKLRDHSLLRRNPPDDESSVAVALPTEVGETQERDGLWFSLSALLPVDERRTARTRSIVSCPHVVPSRTSPVVPGTLSGSAQHPFGAESPPQDLG